MIGKSVRLKLISILVIAVMGLTFLIPLGACAEESQGLTISDAIDLAVKKSSEIQKAQISVRQAEIARDDAAEAVTFIPTGGMVLPSVQQVFNAYQQAEIALSAAKKTLESQKKAVIKNTVSAYVAVIKAKNTLDQARLSLDKLQKQVKVAETSRKLGMVSDYDWNTLQNSLSQAAEGVKAAEASYKSACLALNELLGRPASTEVNLVSRPVITRVAKDSLEQEYSRVINDSVLVLKAQSELQVEQSKQPWILPDTTSEQKQLSLSSAEINWEQAKKDARTQVQNAYYGIEALEKQIEAAQQALALAKQNLDVANIKYKVGTLPLVTASGSGDLMTARVDYEKAKVTLQNLQADLVNTKAAFYYITGRDVYDAADWQTSTASTVDAAIIAQPADKGVRAVFTVGSRQYKLNGTVITMDVAPYIKGSRTYIPVGYLAKALGASAQWDGASKTATLTRGSNQVVLKVGDYNITVNGKVTTMEVKPELVNGRVMLPARYVAEGLGATVSWDVKDKSVSIYN